MDDQGYSKEDRLKDSKDTEFYSQTVAAWYNSALEHDKSLLTLSVAGIGVLVSTMLTAIHSALSFILYAGAIIGFLVCLISILQILQKNKKYLSDTTTVR